ncbi:fluoride efflux transporter CrcB [Herbaspirillum sp. BH-1]|uniref:Fluoride-specific ion channel FluC n=2 Tax=Oxalobacteraceae TaxID=75682 RepID=A0ABU1P8B6_9BURK|nr:CrcB protein [Herbaspirillum frisingense]PLY59336.1 fluoride efflux transporter CrcB [Herbaspirillum sp. BH-1]
MMGWLAVGLGATLGAWLRWRISVVWNISGHFVPLGTLAANWLGAYVIGFLVAYFEQHPGLSPEWRLFAVTGFLGGLTTFSTFSAEAMILLQRGDYLWAIGHSALHLLGSIVLCVAGFASYRALAG